MITALTEVQKTVLDDQFETARLLTKDEALVHAMQREWTLGRLSSSTIELWRKGLRNSSFGDRTLERMKRAEEKGTESPDVAILSSITELKQSEIINLVEASGWEAIL